MAVARSENSSGNTRAGQKTRSELLQAVNVLIIAACARSQREVLNGCVDLSICLVFSVIAATTLPHGGFAGRATNTIRPIRALRSHRNWNPKTLNSRESSTAVDIASAPQKPCPAVLIVSRAHRTRGSDLGSPLFSVDSFIRRVERS